jgi:hypothetical protein
MRPAVKNPKPSAVMVAGAYAGALLLLVAALGGTVFLDQPLASFFDEPQYERWYLGFVSTLGGLVWWSGAVVCLVTAWVVRASDRTILGFWLASAALTAVLALDDLFLLHESLIRRRLHSPEWFTFLVYALAAVAIAVVYRRQMRTMPRRLLLVGMGFALVSVSFDQLNPRNQADWMVLVEEGTKLFAIMSWTMFFVLSSGSYLERRDETAKASPDPAPHGSSSRAHGA